MSSQKVKISDAEARKFIAKKLNKNFFVEASAGSGKTTSLVLRMVAMVEAGTPVDKICTITFTKAAADEFFSRFQQLLSIRSVNIPDESDDDLGPKSEKSCKLCQEALNNIDSCFMGTIDAFCNTIAHELPIELHIPSDSEIISNEEKKNVIKEEYDNILKNRKHRLHKYAMLFKKFDYRHYDIFVLAIDAISEKRNTEIYYDKSLIDIDFNQYFAQEKAELLDFFNAIGSANLHFGNSGVGLKRAKAQAMMLSYYNLFKNIDLNKKIIDFYRSLSIIGNIDRVEVDDYVPSIAPYLIGELNTKGDKIKFYKFNDDVIGADGLKNRIIRKLDNLKHSLMFYIATEALSDVSNKLKKEGKFQFYDFLLYTTKAFQHSSATDRKLVDHILERHSYFLLDESQDTNPMQTEMFFYLTGTMITDNWKLTKPRPGSLFIVGDPKQSIYAFRGANVLAYKTTERIFENEDEVLILSKNFRSNVKLRKWFNEAMNPILHREGDEDSLEHTDIDIPDEDLKAVTEGTLEQDDIVLDGEYKYWSEYGIGDSINVATIINELVNNPKYKIVVKKNKKDGHGYKYRRIEYKDFMIVPRNGKINDMISVFHNSNIPFIAEAKIPFDLSDPLKFVYTLTSFIKDHSDKSKLLKVLIDLYGFDNFDISQLANDGFSFNIADFNDEMELTDPDIKDVLKEVNNFFMATKDLSYSSVMFAILNDKNIKLLEYINTEYLEYLYFFIERVKEREEAGLLSGIDDYVKLYEEFTDTSNPDVDNRVLRFKNKVNCVKISNLHKVKGLQAPIVILCEPLSKIRSALEFVDYNATPVTSYVRMIKMFNERHNCKEAVLESHAFTKQQLDRWQKFADAEDDRLQYVGATRAESVLIVADTVIPEKEKDSARKTWDKLLEHIDNSRYLIINKPVPFTKPDYVNIEYQNSQINKDCNNQSINYHSPSLNVGDYKLTSQNTNLDDINDDKKEDATLIGTMVHKLMQVVVSSKNSISDIESIVNKIMSDYGDTKYHDLLISVYNTMTSGGYPQKNSEVEQDILDVLMKAEEVLCETPFSYKRKDGTIVSGIIDLIYKDDSGYHIIDYKTNQEDDVSILEKEYAGQLSDYQEALKEFGIDADAHIYHIDVK